ncbi:MAG: hypothetical protein M1822_008102 [Bathelium mastoideum]|nr:MAG: hypothetical protein M1822_008102 [Bathelium mastoideum]
MDMAESTDRIVRRDGRVRKRAPNACVRCKKQKIKCSATVPCEQCKKRSVLCDFDTRQQKILVTQSYISELEGRAARLGRGSTAEEYHEPSADVEEDNDERNHRVSRPATPQATSPNDSGSIDGADKSSHPDPEGHENGLRSVLAADLTNPLDPVNSDAFIVNNASKRYFLGVSSNWSFGRRVLSMVHSKVNGAPLSAAALLFEGSTYDLGWDGQRNSAMVDTSILPAADFATYLINAVKFHCGQLFHMFDETTFMHHFRKFYEDPNNERNCPRLWYIHFLVILAFGKGFIVRAKNGKRPPGSELFVQAMKLLPDITYMWSDAIQSIEILCCSALYHQCLDNRSAAYNMIGQALRMAVEQGMHTDMRSLHMSETQVERCREAWWTIYVLDRQMTSLMGVPMSLSDDDITAPLPSFLGSLAKQKALDIHIKLARANAMILQTVYGKTGGRSERFLASMKEALRTIAEANNELNEFYSLNLQQPVGGLSRLSATLHLFHHQALILATRPLLYSFLQKRLEANRPLRCLKLLETLQSQSLLESFIPFDREATFSSSVVICVAATVDPSLVKDRDSRFVTACTILDGMVTCGNLIADFQRRELDQLDFSLRRLQEMSSTATSHQQAQHETPESASSYMMEAVDGQVNRRDQTMPDVGISSLLGEWNSEDGLNGEQLLAVVESLDYGQLNWSVMGDLDAWS